jgi:hypothetical protein
MLHSTKNTCKGWNDASGKNRLARRVVVKMDELMEDTL